MAHIQAMRTVSQEDKLLGRGANPRTGRITPTNESTDSSEINQQRKRTKLDPISTRHGNWKRNKHSWNFVRTAKHQGDTTPSDRSDEELILRFRQENGHLHLVDPSTPATPPSSVSLQPHETFKIKRKPVGSGQRQRTPSPEQEIPYYRLTRSKANDPCKTTHLPTRLNRPLRNITPSTMNHSANTTSKRSNPGQVRAAARVGASETSRRISPPDSDTLTGWVVETNSNSNLDRKAHTNPNSPARIGKHYQSTTDPMTTPSPHLSPRRERRLHLHNQPRQSDSLTGWVVETGKPNAKPRQPMLPQTTPSPKLLPKRIVIFEPSTSSMDKLDDSSEDSLLLYLEHWNTLRKIVCSTWLKQRALVFVRHILHMLLHITKTFIDLDESGGQTAGILKRNSPKDLLLCLVYGVVLLVGLRAISSYLLLLVRSIRVLVEWGGWIVNLV